MGFWTKLSDWLEEIAEEHKEEEQKRKEDEQKYEKEMKAKGYIFACGGWVDPKAKPLPPIPVPRLFDKDGREIRPIATLKILSPPPKQNSCDLTYEENDS